MGKARDKDLKREKILGASIGTAHAWLSRKYILYLFKKVFGHSKCYRCGVEVRDFRMLSLDHKESWKNHDSFYDMENLSISHRQCNFRHGGSITNSSAVKLRHTAIIEAELLESRDKLVLGDEE